MKGEIGSWVIGVTAGGVIRPYPTGHTACLPPIAPRSPPLSRGLGKAGGGERSGE